MTTWPCARVISQTSCHSPAGPEYQAHGYSSWLFLFCKTSKQGKGHIYCTKSNLLHQTLNITFIWCLFQCWQLISLFCELETSLLLKTLSKKKQSYGPHLIPSQKTFMCSSLPFFSLAFSLSPSPPFALLFFVSELKSDQNTDVMDLCSAFGHAEWLSGLFFSHRTASSYCARRPLRESRPNYQSRGA